MCHWLASGTAIDGGNTWSQIPSAIIAVPKPARPVTKPPASAPASSRKIAAVAIVDADFLRHSRRKPLGPGADRRGRNLVDPNERPFRCVGAEMGWFLPFLNRPCGQLLWRLCCR